MNELTYSNASMQSSLVQSRDVRAPIESVDGHAVNPVFVVGPARSGTTVLAHMIASELNVRCSPETNFMSILRRIEQRTPALSFHQFERRQHEFLLHGENRDYSILFARDLRNERIADFPTVFCETLMRADAYSEGDHPLEQTPRNGEHLSRLRSLFNDALILFVVRDPFDTIQSLRKTPFGRRPSVAHFANWGRQYQEAAKLIERFGPRRFRFVRYTKLSLPTYRESVLNWCERRGVERRHDGAVVIRPANFARSDWARRHFSRSTTDFQPDHAKKWTKRWPALGRLGKALLLAALRSARHRKAQRLRIGDMLLAGCATVSRR